MQLKEAIFGGLRYYSKKKNSPNFPFFQQARNHTLLLLLPGSFLRIKNDAAKMLHHRASTELKKPKKNGHFYTTQTVGNSPSSVRKIFEKGWGAGNLKYLRLMKTRMKNF